MGTSQPSLIILVSLSNFYMMLRVACNTCAVTTFQRQCVFEVIRWSRLESALLLLMLKLHLTASVRKAENHAI